jgi:hypothetical protein
MIQNSSEEISLERINNKICPVGTDQNKIGSVGADR